MAKDIFTIACFGDVVGRPGRELLRQKIPGLRSDRRIDCVIVNSENASGGRGLEPQSADEIFAAGVDVITLGDHTWQAKDLRGYLETNRHRCIRPANYPDGAKGRGWTLVEINGLKIGVMNLIGRVFTGLLVDCPFRKADEILDGPLAKADFVVCDMHAEATSEKIGMARWLDGRAAIVFGTHTHVQTADERLLPGGTAAISDVGMCGSMNGVLGMDADVALERLTTGLPSAYKVAEGAPALHGIVCVLDRESKKPISIERIRID